MFLRKKLKAEIKNMKGEMKDMKMDENTLKK
jgi:hypothetical protein